MKRVVITGLGIFSCIGNGVDEVLRSLQNGQSGIGISQRRKELGYRSPLTFRDYTFTPQGSAYGLVKNYQNPLPTTIPTQTKLRNLLLTGQNVFVPGAIGVTMTAAMTCANIIGEEYLAKKIAEA